MYGNYVLLKCLETMRKERLEFIIKPVEDSVLMTVIIGIIHGAVDIWMPDHIESFRDIYHGIDRKCVANHNEHGDVAMLL